MAPEKSYWYLVEVTRSGGKWTYKRERDSPGELVLANGTATNKRLEVYQARKALGIMVRPDGKMIDQMKELKKKTAQWCDGIRTRRIHPEEAWYSLTATILKTLEYPLTATTFTADQCKELLRPVLKTALPLCRIQRRLPRALVHGSIRSRGLDLPNLYWVQLIHHLHTILRHMHRNSPSQELHTENMDLVQFHIGSTVNFWELPFEEYGSLAPDGWMKNTWQALSQTTLSFKGPQFGLLDEREDDRALMDAFVAQGYDTKTLTTLNECRFWLAASHLSHISTANGLEIDTRCWEGKQHAADMRPRVIHTFHPKEKDWRVWREKVRETFLHPNTDHLRLRQPLGRWKAPVSATWKWWKHQQSQTLYEQRDAGGWNKWVRVPRRHQQEKFKDPVAIDSICIPQGLVRASVKVPKRSTYVTVTSTGGNVPINPAPPEPSTLKERIARLPETAKWALQHVTMTDDGKAIAEAIKTQTAVAVSDGGLKMGLGTAAYVIEGATAEGRVQGVNKVPGPIKEGDSLRCEASGIYAVILLIKEICSLHQVTEGSIKICCDNTSALKLFDPEYLPDPKQSNLDLIGASWAIKNTIPIEWSTEHVKGHQDRHSTTQGLSRIAKLNVAMDKTATAYWIHLVSNSRRMPSPVNREIYGEGWQLWKGEYKITHPNRKTLYSIMQDVETNIWWMRENHISPQAHAIIDYEAVEDVMKQLKGPRRRYVTKVASENCGVGSTLQAWKFQTNAGCPRCEHELETTRHVQQCQGYAANTAFSQNMTKVQQFLTREQTRPDVHEAIVGCIQKWRAQQPIHLNEYARDVQEVIMQQHQIGWLDFLECLPAKGWQSLQKRYYREEGLQKSSRRWLRGLLLQLHHLGYGQWLHRCDIKNNVTKTSEKEHIETLHVEIEKQFLMGKDDLATGDQTLLDYNILELMDRSLAYKKGWVTRLWAARQRAQRIAQKKADLIVQSKEASQLYQWFKYHKEETRKRKWSTIETSKETVAITSLQGPYVDDQEYLCQVVAEPAIREEHGQSSIRRCEGEQEQRQQLPMQQHPLLHCTQEQHRHQDHVAQGED
ncbi:MAG: hypothetical protein ACRCZI_13415, partial [Cetobacterium sp.]